MILVRKIPHKWRSGDSPLFTYRMKKKGFRFRQKKRPHNVISLTSLVISFKKAAFVRSLCVWRGWEGGEVVHILRHPHQITVAN